MIGNEFVKDCINLTNVLMPQTVTSLGMYVFRNCASLGNLTIPGSVKTLATAALAYTSGITNLVFSPGLTNLASFSVSGCSNLTTVDLPNTLTSIDLYAFENCPKLKALFFRGSAPSVVQTSFWGATNATAHYLPGSSGWGTTFGGIPTAVWVPTAMASGSEFGIQNGAFGFNVSWARGQTIVVEACADLSNPSWIPIFTNILSNDSAYISDAAWVDLHHRLYRIRSP